MKIKLSNSATDLHKIQVYVFYLVDLAILVVLIVNIIEGNSLVILLALMILVLFSTITLISRKYSSRLCEAYIDDEYLYLENGKLTDKIELSNIKSLKYHPFYIHPMTEDIIVVLFQKETTLGRKIYIYPTNLNKEKEYKSNRQILSLIAEKANNYINAKTTNANKSNPCTTK
ncbi:hypothetical protein L3049_07085 [Labilibaculum sp. DW002]|uniref:YcxB-like protein domain-containing protein n=1 Tax=Paralabilibaculum antarcticum TaxID=2912572 RepID=A0ABT5VQS0_9BACT|nr:hypothetical protein [Labilibaculum sp. DW002]MDE5417769.1 hypothetical protein [Labilibaculum sp. DW002]